MIGGTLLTGGYGYVLGSVVGVFVLAALRLIITKDGTINPEYLTIITGAHPARLRAPPACADASEGKLMADGKIKAGGRGSFAPDIEAAIGRSAGMSRRCTRSWSGMAWSYGRVATCRAGCRVRICS